MNYRIKEIKITNTYSEYKIQRLILVWWINVNVDPRYECSFASANQWIKLKQNGLPVNKFYYG